MKAKLFIDKMPETCDFCEFNDYSEGGMCTLHYGVCPVGERADFCPLKPLSQVEAIPVEWIEKWLDEFLGVKLEEEITDLDPFKKNVYQGILLMYNDWRRVDGK